MKLYFSKGACSLVVRIVINEIGIQSSYEAVDLKTKQTEKDRNFLEINPKGAVPTIQVESGEILTENAVILQYLADSSKSTELLPALGDFKRYRVLEWLNYITTELHKGFGPLFNPLIPKEVKDQYFLPPLITKFKQIDKKLKGQYLMGDTFTLPDAYLFVMLRWAAAFHFELSDCSNLTAFKQRVENRESVKRSLEEEGLEKLS